MNDFCKKGVLSIKEYQCWTNISKNQNSIFDGNPSNILDFVKK